MYTMYITCTCTYMWYIYIHTVCTAIQYIYSIVHFVASTHLHTCRCVHVNTIDHFLTILHITCT